MIVKSDSLTEFKIQNILFYWCVKKRGHAIAVANTYLHAWEADLISVTKAGYVHEFEVKISKQDFKKDAQKTKKHVALTEQTNNSVPSHFWYVCPDGLIDVDDVPNHAGLIYIKKYNRPHVVKKAPRLSKMPINQKQSDKMMMASAWRYWAMRSKIMLLEQQHRSKQSSIIFT